MLGGRGQFQGDCQSGVIGIGTSTQKWPLPLGTETVAHGGPLPLQSQTMAHGQSLPWQPETVAHGRRLSSQPQSLPWQPETVAHGAQLPSQPRTMAHGQPLPWQPESVAHGRRLSLQPETKAHSIRSLPQWGRSQSSMPDFTPLPDRNENKSFGRLPGDVSFPRERTEDRAPGRLRQEQLDPFEARGGGRSDSEPAGTASRPFRLTDLQPSVKPGEGKTMRPRRPSPPSVSGATAPPQGEAPREAGSSGQDEQQLIENLILHVHHQSTQIAQLVSSLENSPRRGPPAPVPQQTQQQGAGETDVRWPKVAMVGVRCLQGSASVTNSSRVACICSLHETLAERAAFTPSTRPCGPVGVQGAQSVAWDMEPVAMQGYTGGPLVFAVFDVHGTNDGGKTILGTAQLSAEQVRQGFHGELPMSGRRRGVVGLLTVRVLPPGSPARGGPCKPGAVPRQSELQLALNPAPTRRSLAAPASSALAISAYPAFPDASGGRPPPAWWNDFPTADGRPRCYGGVSYV